MLSAPKGQLENGTAGGLAADGHVEEDFRVRHGEHSDAELSGLNSWKLSLKVRYRTFLRFYNKMIKL